MYAHPSTPYSSIWGTTCLLYDLYASLDLSCEREGARAREVGRKMRMGWTKKWHQTGTIYDDTTRRINLKWCTGYHSITAGCRCILRPRPRMEEPEILPNIQIFTCKASQSIAVKRSTPSPVPAASTHRQERAHPHQRGTQRDKHTAKLQAQD